MAREPIGVISHGTIGRTTSKRRDDAGIPIEETVPSLRSLKFYDLDGNECMIPVHSHRAFVPNFDDKVRPRVVRDRLGDGFLEAQRCPHMPREQLDDKPSVPAPPKFTVCDGKGRDEKTGIDGCAHLVAVVVERRKRSAEKAASRKNTAQGAVALQMAQALAKQATTTAAQSAQRNTSILGRASE